MTARTPLSTRAAPFTPLSSRAPGFTPSWQASGDCSAYASGVPVFFPAATVKSVEAVKTTQRRGRFRNKETTCRLPSRTPSPSGWSACHSDSSTTHEGSLVGTMSSSDITEASEDFSDALDIPVRDLPVKNTFVHLSKESCDSGDAPRRMSRSSSAPSLLLTCQFLIMTMQELHAVGRCSPCAYLYGKEDGCRRGAECTFCHECPADELKNRKKIRMKAIKAKRAAERARAQVDVDVHSLAED